MMLLLLIGAVTMASMRPLRRSLVANLRAANDAFPAVGVENPGSTFSSSSVWLMMLMRFGWACDASRITV